MKSKITKRSVEKLQKGEAIWDTEIPGFGCRFQARGRRGYVYKFTYAGRQVWHSIGLHGAPWTPDQAREEAKRLAGKVSSGENPARARAERRRLLSLQDLAERFMAEHVATKDKASTAREYQRLFDRIVIPRLGRHRIDTVSRVDVAQLHHDLSPTPYQANRVLSVISKMMSWAEKHGMRPDGGNPCRHIEKYPESRRERFLFVSELKRLGEVLSEAEVAWRNHAKAAHETQQGRMRNPKPAKNLVSLTAIAAIRLLTLTGARLSEILELTWDEVDLERGILRLADSKTGAKPIYLNSPALDMLSTLPRIEDNKYVLPGQKSGSHLVNLQKPWRIIRARAALDDVRLHDLRHSYASVAAGLGQSLVVIGKLLGHTQSQTTARYAHLAQDPVRKAADDVGNLIADAMRGER